MLGPQKGLVPKYSKNLLQQSESKSKDQSNEQEFNHIDNQKSDQFKLVDDSSILNEYEKNIELLEINEEQLKELYENIIIDLKFKYEKYVSDKIEYLNLKFVENNNQLPKKKQLKNINFLNLNKDLVKISKIRNSFNSKILPLTLNEKTYGKKQISTFMNQIRFYSVIDKELEIRTYIWR